MPILLPNPEFVISSLVLLVQRCQYAYLLRKYQRHWLVQFEQVIDLTPLETGSAAFHWAAGGAARSTTPCRAWCAPC